MISSGNPLNVGAREKRYQARQPMSPEPTRATGSSSNWPADAGAAGYVPGLARSLARHRLGGIAVVQAAPAIAFGLGERTQSGSSPSGARRKRRFIEAKCRETFNRPT